MRILNEVHPKRFCPVCNRDLRGGDILESLYEQNGGDCDEALRNAIEFYGYSEDDPQYFYNVIGVQTNQYDGTTWYLCPECSTHWKRFEWSDDKYLAEQRIC